MPGRRPEGTFDKLLPIGGRTRLGNHLRKNPERSAFEGLFPTHEKPVAIRGDGNASGGRLLVHAQGEQVVIPGNALGKAATGIDRGPRIRPGPAVPGRRHKSIPGAGVPNSNRGRRSAIVATAKS